jgi:TRAP-type C4-dicarboxylate transport system permease small subunit
LKLVARIQKFEETIAKFLMALIIILVFLAAILRWFGIPVVWSVDIAQLLFGWVVFFGANMALRNNGHIGIDILVNMFPVKVRQAVMLFHYALISIFLIMLGAYGFHLSAINYERTFNTINLSYSYATVSVPVGCVLMLITVLGKVRELLKQS